MYDLILSYNDENNDEDIQMIPNYLGLTPFKLSAAEGNIVVSISFWMLWKTDLTENSLFFF